MDFAATSLLWSRGDKVVLRVKPADGDEAYLTTSTVQVRIATTNPAHKTSQSDDAAKCSPRHLALPSNLLHCRLITK
eukprot:814426-Amphidinium_carterae.1